MWLTSRPDNFHIVKFPSSIVGNPMKDGYVDKEAIRKWSIGFTMCRSQTENYVSCYCTSVELSHLKWCAWLMIISPTPLHNLHDYGMTITKSQCQTLHLAAIYLPNFSIFSHGQLYAAASRVCSKKGLHFTISTSRIQGVFLADGKTYTKNLVYKEIL